MLTKRKTILVLDDEVDLLDLLRSRLTKSGYNVVTAENGVEGLEKLQRIKPDLIIMDINMPKMGGIEFYKQILDAEGKPKYPIFVLTIRANMETLFRDLDIDGFMPKPYDAHHLLEEIAKVFAKKEATEDRQKTNLGSRQVFIADSNRERLQKIAWYFLEHGFRVNTAVDSITAMEHLHGNIPDIALINYHLDDIPGDTLARKMTKMARTRSIQFILYTGQYTQDLTILEDIRRRSEPHQLVESDRPDDLLEAVKSLSRSKER